MSPVTGEPLHSSDGAFLEVFDSPAAHGVLFNLGMLSSSTLAHAAPTAVERSDMSSTVTVVKPSMSLGDVQPGSPAGFCDGIQTTVPVTWRNHQPVVVGYVAAGAATPHMPVALVGLVERFALYTGGVDVSDIAEETKLPVVRVSDDDVTGVYAKISAAISDERSRCERRLVNQLLAKGGDRQWVVDGSLAGMPPDNRLVGVVKTHKAKYMSDETQVWSLPVGHRSQVFSFTHPPHRDETEAVEVFSAYVRLVTHSASAWDVGLVRVETTSLDTIDTACATVFAARPDPLAAAADARGDRHVGAVAWCEKLLRDRRPLVLAGLSRGGN